MNLYSHKLQMVMVLLIYIPSTRVQEISNKKTNLINLSIDKLFHKPSHNVIFRLYRKREIEGISKWNGVNSLQYYDSVMIV